jgi:putative FmdB family regulatory protein
MPIYEFKCKKCKEEFEKFVLSYSQVKQVKCPKCGGEVEKKVSACAVGGSGSSGAPSGGACNAFG